MRADARSHIGHRARAEISDTVSPITRQTRTHWCTVHGGYRTHEDMISAHMISGRELSILYHLCPDTGGPALFCPRLFFDDSHCQRKGRDGGGGGGDRGGGQDAARRSGRGAAALACQRSHSLHGNVLV